MSSINVMKMEGKFEGRTVAVNAPEQVKLANGRTLISSLPRLVKLNMRPAASAPEGTRVKYTLDMTIPHGDHEHTIPCPVAQATVVPMPMLALCVESRLEMN